MESIPTDTEIKQSLKGMARGKASGPDGYNVNIFIGVWVIVRADVLAAVRIVFTFE